MVRAVGCIELGDALPFASVGGIVIVSGPPVPPPLVDVVLPAPGTWTTTAIPATPLPVDLHVTVTVIVRWVPLPAPAVATTAPAALPRCGFAIH